MRAEVKDACPLNKFKPCKRFECAWYIKVTGKDPQSEKHVDAWNCAISWLPMLLVENSQRQIQTGAAVESFRNEMVTANKTSQKILLQGIMNGRQGDTKSIENQTFSVDNLEGHNE